MKSKGLGDTVEKITKATGIKQATDWIFDKIDSTEAIKVRIDDKLARIKNKGLNDKTEDTLSDLIGYLVLLKIAYIKNEK